MKLVRIGDGTLLDLTGLTGDVDGARQQTLGTA